MKQNTRLILILLVIIVISVIFLKRQKEGFFASLGWYRGPAALAATSCPAGYEVFLFSNKGNYTNYNEYLCVYKRPVAFDSYIEGQAGSEVMKPITKTSAYLNKSILMDSKVLDIATLTPPSCGANESNVDKTELMILKGTPGDDIFFKDKQTATKNLFTENKLESEKLGAGMIGFKCTKKSAAAPAAPKLPPGIRNLCIDNNVLKPYDRNLSLRSRDYCTPGYSVREYNNGNYVCTNADGLPTTQSLSSAICNKPGFIVDNKGYDYTYNCYDCVKAPTASTSTRK